MTQRFKVAIIAKLPSDGNGKELPRVWLDPRTGGHDQMGEFEKALVFFPEMQVAEGIQADDEEELVLRLFPAQNLQGMDRIALSFRRASRSEATKAGWSAMAASTMARRRRRRPLRHGFVRRGGGGNEQDPVEGAGLAHLLGNAQMRKVNRIEGAAQDSGSHKGNSEG